MEVQLLDRRDIDEQQQHDASPTPASTSTPTAAQDDPASAADASDAAQSQIDNQLNDAVFPVVLQPTPIAKDSSGVASLPTIQGSVIWLKDQGE